MKITLAVALLSALVLVSVSAEGAMLQAPEDEAPTVRCDPFLNGLASLVIPGWGQWLNGERGQAVQHLAVWVGLGVGAFLLQGTPASLLLGVGASLWNLYSAYNAFSTCVGMHEELEQP